MFEETARLSIIAPVWILAFRITYYSFLEVLPTFDFHRKMSELRNIHFCSGSDIEVNRAD